MSNKTLSLWIYRRQLLEAIVVKLLMVYSVNVLLVITAFSELAQFTRLQFLYLYQENFVSLVSVYINASFFKFLESDFYIQDAAKSRNIKVQLLNLTLK